MNKTIENKEKLVRKYEKHNHVRTLVEVRYASVDGQFKSYWDVFTPFKPQGNYPTNSIEANNSKMDFNDKLEMELIKQCKEKGYRYLSHFEMTPEDFVVMTSKKGN